VRREREESAKARVAFQKKSRAQAKILPITTLLMDEYIRREQIRFREKKIGYKKEFLAEGDIRIADDSENSRMRRHNPPQTEFFTRASRTALTSLFPF